MSGEQTFGFLGAGHLASFVIEALRRGGHDGPIVLSPRNAATAADVAARFSCEVATSNQQVIDKADILVLSMRPQHLDAAIDGLRFRESQIVISALAGIPLDELKAKPGMPQRIVRLMPSSFIAAGDAVWPLYPADKEVEALFAATGKTVVFGDEPSFDMATLAACAYSWTYDLMDNLAGWFESNGWPPGVARDMVIASVRGATTFALANPDTSLSDISAGIATEGTFTKAGLDHLNECGAFEPWREALDMLHAKLR